MFKKKPKEVRNKEYWKKYLLELTFVELAELSSAIYEYSMNMKNKIKYIENKDKGKDDRSYS